ncbi:MAG: metal-dependent transcriptional regulator [Ruminococcus sp.]|nr:metal-dependent transcriptional regulator [Ruminococcus sp.]MCD7800352.1 metal-dependent transcriptional regulator [Ruminococcus sp.]
MKICSGQIKYLVAILELSNGSKNVRGVDISKYLEVTRPSVTKMLKCLASSNLIDENFSYGVNLTDEGLEVATKFHKQYRYIYIFFFNMLKLSEKEAREQALEFISSFPIETSTKFSVLVRNTIKRQQQKNDR